MNDKAQELNAEEREGLTKVLAMDVNDLLETHIAHIKARVMYLTEETKARFPFISEAKPASKPKGKITASPDDAVQ